ncbi:uncharacterized protein LOC127278933 [Leptopilina boulardi]|uniref:uncharacterized protein LOC127278933 n=1 Tax=Leptopilina boulardi TaxID=63433 RepID=UPI0021F53427|nr:uncharacterized protein LOC127278933 [Leptopilina boulardi]
MYLKESDIRTFQAGKEKTTPLEFVNQKQKTQSILKDKLNVGPTPQRSVENAVPIVQKLQTEKENNIQLQDLTRNEIASSTESSSQNTSTGSCATQGINSGISYWTYPQTAVSKMCTLQMGKEKVVKLTLSTGKPNVEQRISQNMNAEESDSKTVEKDDAEEFEQMTESWE